MLKFLSSRRVILLIVAVVLASLFGPHVQAQMVVQAGSDWKKVPNFPAKWKSELGTKPGDIILSVEYQCGKERPLYTLLKECARPKTYSSLGWVSGTGSGNHRTCEGRWLTSNETAVWERKGGTPPGRPPNLCTGSKRESAKK
jgi:hypothetical protein